MYYTIFLFQTVGREIGKNEGRKKIRNNLLIFFTLKTNLYNIHNIKGISHSLCKNRLQNADWENLL